MHNVIVLTTGSSGSSVLAGIISTQGYWLGDDTKMLNFNTYENSRLVDLDSRIIKLSGFGRASDCNDIPPPSVEKIKALHGEIDPEPFTGFINASREHEPFLWKDPRMAFTIHYWAQLMDMKPMKFIFIDRDPYQSYAGLILSRRVPMSFTEQKTMNKNYRLSCNRFFKEYGIECFTCTYEDLILHPVPFIRGLNDFLGTRITMENVREVYHGALNRKHYRSGHILKAFLYYCIYRFVKNEHIRFPRYLNEPGNQNRPRGQKNGMGDSGH